MALRWQRPTLDTRFHIDVSWWSEQDRDIRVYLRELLCDSCGTALATVPPDEMIDSVDPETAEVQQIDALWGSLLTCCSKRAGFIDGDMPIVDGVFRVFVSNGNKPLSIRELHTYIERRMPETILRTLTAGEVYLGIRPYRE